MRLLTGGLLVMMLGMAACGGSEDSPQITTSPGTDATSTVTRGVTLSTVIALEDLEPIVVPTLPDEIPGYAQEDPATGLHVTGTPVAIDPAEYRLRVTGKVDHELSLSYDELRQLPKLTATPVLVCPGLFEDTTTWSGVPLKTILETAGVRPGADRVRMTGADGYWVFLDVDKALLPENLLAYEWMGEPLPVLHGFPLRAVIPSKGGSVWVKWLVEISLESSAAS